MFRKSLLLALVTASTLSAPALLAPADASVPAPAMPTGVHYMKSGHSWLQIGANASAHATGYRLYASTTRENVYAVNLAKAHHSRVYSGPTTVIRSLPVTSSPYYYRVQAINGHHHKLSDTIGMAGLRPARPDSVLAVANSAGVVLSWKSGSVAKIRIAQAANPDLTANRTDYTVSGATRRFTPYGLSAGKTYYFKVQARNHGGKSYWSSMVSAVATHNERTVRVLTYNVLKKTSDGTKDNVAGNTVAPWSQRRDKAAALVRSATPDVVGIEEGGYYVGNPYDGVRQVDDLTHQLPGYVVAPTETPKPPNYGQIFQDYVVYNTATVNRVAGAPNGCSCGIWEMGHGHRAAFAVLQMKSGGRFLFVAPHLANPTFSDDYRRSETNTLLADVAAYNDQNLPVVYAGDFNSDMRAGHADVPGTIMKTTLTEASTVAQTKYHPTYDSYNGYHVTPPQHGLYIDRVFVTPGVGVKSWGIMLDLHGGSFSGVIPSDHNPVFAAVTIPVRD